MKKTIVILVIIMVMFSLAGCGEGKTKTDAFYIDETRALENESSEPVEELNLSDQESESEITIEPSGASTSTEEVSEGIEVDEGLLNVTITIPASFFEDKTDFDPDTYAEENGFKEAVVNEDGSVTITMSKRKHNELMAEMETDVNRILEGMVESENTTYIKEIASSKGYKTVTVSVDKEAYENAWDLTPLSIYFSVAFYQMLDGAKPHCEVIIKDVETGEVLKSVVYPDVFKD